MSRTDRTPLLEARGLEKSFGRVHALRGADFTIYPDEVVALVGDNGAGKSTLVKTLAGVQQPDGGAGVQQPDGGEIHFEGQPVVIESPIAARRLGIETVRHRGGESAGRHRFGVPSAGHSKDVDSTHGPPVRATRRPRRLGAPP